MRNEVTCNIDKVSRTAHQMVINQTNYDDELTAKEQEIASLKKELMNTRRNLQEKNSQMAALTLDMEHLIRQISCIPKYSLSH